MDTVMLVSVVERGSGFVANRPAISQAIRSLPELENINAQWSHALVLFGS
ncbi:hypothetical protein [Mycobacterium haemophilum]